MARLVATISGHGFGHLSISAPVLNRLGSVLPRLDLAIVSGLSRERIATRVRAPFAYRHSDLDFGVAMRPDLSVRAGATAERYARLHDAWESKVDQYARLLEELGCDLVLSNVSYLSLAAARRLGIPSLALCSLNWADMYRYFCRRSACFQIVHRQMADSYACADVFLAPNPSMPMDARFAVERIPPVAEIGRGRKSELVRLLGVDPSTRLILVAMGGHDLQFSVNWPDREDIMWLIPGSWNVSHTRVARIEDLDLPFLDLLASTDLLVTKPGYGSFTEAACAGKPVLYTLRPDWPEEKYLVDWLQRHCACRELDPARLRSGDFVDDVLALLDTAPVAEPPLPAGIDAAVTTIRRLLNGRRP